jgi:hypothetical protein
VARAGFKKGGDWLSLQLCFRALAEGDTGQNPHSTGNHRRRAAHTVN